MYRKPLVVAIHDPKWFMKVLSILRSRRIDFSVFENINNTPHYSVLYTDYYYYVELISSRKDIEVIYDPDKTCCGLEKSILATMSKEEYSRVVVGIDPGKYPYYVILGDEDLLEHGYIFRENIADYLNNKLECYPTKKRIIRIGGGFNGWKIVLKLRNRVNAIIEIVDENIENIPINYLLKTQRFEKKYIKFRYRDAYDALKIALCEGVEVE